MGLVITVDNPPRSRGGRIRQGGHEQAEERRGEPHHLDRFPTGC